MWGNVSVVGWGGHERWIARGLAVYRVLRMFFVSPSQASHFSHSSECRPQKSNQKGLPLHPGPASRAFPRSVIATGAGAMGHPWPGAPLAASMPLVPLCNDCARPPEGAGSLPQLLSYMQFRSALQMDCSPKNRRHEGATGSNEQCPCSDPLGADTFSHWPRSVVSGRRHGPDAPVAAEVEAGAWGGRLFQPAGEFAEGR